MPRNDAPARPDGTPNEGQSNASGPALGWRTTIIIVVCACAVVAVSFAIRNQRPAKRIPARAVRDRENPFDIMIRSDSTLTAYYSEHHKYPRSLSEMPSEAWQWLGTSSPPTNLAAWNYTSDGQTFTMTMTGGFGHESFLGAGAAT
ncbi:MAG TPA: hypothetical protein VGF13_21285, partial [Verrucomicrobiae bacterium]